MISIHLEVGVSKPTILNLVLKDEIIFVDKIRKKVRFVSLLKSSVMNHDGDTIKYLKETSVEKVMCIGSTYSFEFMTILC